LKGLALEIIFKWSLLIVVAMIAIGLIFFFRDNIRKFFENFFNTDQTDGGRVVNSTSFSESQVKTFIKACWDKYNSTHINEVLCYVLQGDVRGVQPDSLLTTLDSKDLVDVTKFNNQIAVTFIKSTGRKILVESLT